MWYERHQDHLLTLSPCALFRHLAGRTLWIVGDSQMQATIGAFAKPDSESQFQSSKVAWPACTALSIAATTLKIACGAVCGPEMPLTTGLAATPMPWDLLVAQQCVVDGPRTLASH